MDAEESDGSLIFSQDISDSLRLDAQHLLWRLHNGYALHPGINKTDHMSIADIGTGTGIWLFDLAQELPKTATLHGYDTSVNRYPSRDLWPENVELDLMDSLHDLPERLVGKYDVVHMRMWAGTLKTQDVDVLIRNAIKLLRPGGYLQWEEANLTDLHIRGQVARDFEHQASKLLASAGFDYSWVFGLSRSLESRGLAVLSQRLGQFPPGLIHICTNTHLLELREIFEGIKKKSSPNVALMEACDGGLTNLISCHNGELVYNWGPLSLLAQKSHQVWSKDD
ncbi:hypothetical protein FDECE_925 [Fusarium decemcellulare]|nr:hypothetical protein FDECE_925 [Fusarium decemcellulare]